jgi:hypothetical protein
VPSLSHQCAALEVVVGFVVVVVVFNVVVVVEVVVVVDVLGWVVVVVVLGVVVVQDAKIIAATINKPRPAQVNLCLIVTSFKFLPGMCQNCTSTNKPCQGWNRRCKYY